MNTYLMIGIALLSVLIAVLAIFKNKEKNGARLSRLLHSGGHLTAIRHRDR